MRSENQRALDAATAAYERTFNTRTVVPEVAALDTEHERALSAALAVFQEQVKYRVWGFRQPCQEVAALGTEYERALAAALAVFQELLMKRVWCVKVEGAVSGWLHWTLSMNVLWRPSSQSSLNMQVKGWG